MVPNSVQVVFHLAGRFNGDETMNIFSVIALALFSGLGLVVFRFTGEAFYAVLSMYTLLLGILANGVKE